MRSRTKHRTTSAAEPPPPPYGSAEELRTAVVSIVRADAALRAQLAAAIGVPDLGRVADELRAMREASDVRFEALTGEMRAMREASDARFEASDRRFDDLTAETRAARKESDERFEAALAEVRASREASERRLDLMDRRLDDHTDLVNVQVGGFQRRAGRSLEDTIAGALRFALDLRDILPEHLRLRQTIEDTDGVVGVRGRAYEYDLLAVNGVALVFEIKSSLKVEDVHRFADKTKLVARALGRDDLQAVLVTLDRRAEIEIACVERGVQIV